MKDGILVIDKPAGLSSTKVVEKVKKKLRVRKAGHGGTLDPFATGVLPICLGRGTKIAQFILEGDKEYEGILELGLETDTYDVTGEVVARHPVPEELTLEDIQRVFDEFVGVIEQPPPAFSAAKLHGRPLYKYAREGLKVEKPPKKVEILEFEALDFHPPRVKFRIYCGKGTYLRSLVHDVGKRLGCGATLVELRRLRKGPFTLEDALTLEEFEELLKRGEIERRIIPPAKALEFIPALTIGEDLAWRIRNGRPLAISSLANMIRLQKVPQKPRVPWLRLVTPDGRLVAVLEYPSDFYAPGNVRMIRVFPEA
ncbi:MAG: tRNA pseudouridine(55) synthase TruB [Thermodesulfobacteria bacterium]|nr:tRNA pseudouridine(55) synthase TruB [Thermodesulfobacteriota bacterium]